MTLSAYEREGPTWECPSCGFTSPDAILVRFEIAMCPLCGDAETGAEHRLVDVVRCRWLGCRAARTAPNGKWCTRHATESRRRSHRRSYHEGQDSDKVPSGGHDNQGPAGSRGAQMGIRTMNGGPVTDGGFEWSAPVGLASNGLRGNLCP